MLTPEQIAAIKQLKEEGYRMSQISRELGISRSTVKEYLESSDIVEQPQRIRKTRLRPQVPDPSPELKAKREAAEAMDLQVDIEKKSKELEKIKGLNDNSVKKKEDEVKLTELNAKQLKIKNEIKKMEKDDREERERGSRKELLEKVKLSLIPPFLRNQLPPSLLAITLSEITSALLPLINLGEMGEEELKIYGKVVRDKVWSDSKYVEIIKSVQRRMVLNALEKCLREFRELLLEEEAFFDETVCVPIQFWIED